MWLSAVVSAFIKIDIEVVRCFVQSEQAERYHKSQVPFFMLCVDCICFFVGQRTEASDFAELARFNKSLEECENDLERMLYVLKNVGRLDNKPEALRHEIFTRIFSACEIAKFSEEKRIQYDQDMYDERRHMGEINTARRIGHEEGVAEGRAEGRAEEKIETARNLMQLGVDIETISKATELPVEAIKNL